MQIAQGIRQAGSAVRRGLARAGERLARIDPDTALWWAKRGAIAFAFLILLYYPVGMIVMNKVDDDLGFAPPQADLKEGESAAVAMAVALIEREVEVNGWVANDPFFKPSALLDNMPNYQTGILAALARFSFELTDQIGRTRGSSQSDPDLQEASGRLQSKGDIWIWNPSTSLMPTASSEALYLKAARSLTAYNERLARGEAVFEKRADNLLATLDRIALDIGSSSAVIDERVQNGAGNFIDSKADDIFYNVKGQMYGYYMILRALGEDFKPVIDARDLTTSYEQMLDSFAKAVALDPWVVVNGRPDGQFLPSHLAAQGFYVLRARTQLREITNILLK